VTALWQVQLPLLRTGRSFYQLQHSGVVCARQIRRLMAGRLEPGWRFSTLYLVKDSLAVMLRSAGLLQDALREFYELEAVYLNAIAGGGGGAGGHDFGELHNEDPRALVTMSKTKQQVFVARQQWKSPVGAVFREAGHLRLWGASDKLPIGCRDCLCHRR